MERENESSVEARPFSDFSGITTIDPDLPSTTPRPQNSLGPKEEAKAPLPLVFRPVDPNLLKLNPEQKKVVSELQQSFLDMIGSAVQDPNYPNYRERWEQAQALIDQLLKAQLGQEFFLRYETAVTTPTKG
jgi:hypothetical protein